MASLTRIREALASTVEANSDVTVHAYVPKTARGKTAFVLPVSMDITTMNTGFVTHQLRLVAIASVADYVTGQQVLDDLLDSDSGAIIRAVFDNKTLGLDDTRAHIGGWGDYGEQDFGDQRFLTASFPVQVHTKGRT